MSFTPGQKVQLKYTGEIGEVVSQAQQGIVQVMLEGNIKIPVNSEDLSSYNPETGFKSIVSNQNLKTIPQIADDRNQQYKKELLTNTGIHVVFVPSYNKYQELIHLDIHLINDSPLDVLFEFEFGDQLNLPHQDGILKSCSSIYLGQINKEIIESHEYYLLRIAEILTSGIEKFIKQTVKLKPKTFFNKEDFAPLMDKLSYIFSFKADVHNTNDISGLKKLTQETVELSKKPELQNVYVHYTDPVRLAEFINELDLHVEALVPNGKKLPQMHLLQLQLSVFDSYIADAVRLGVERVFIIHGLGSGKLKSEIAKRLDYNPYVVNYKNEFHPAYGFGATEVIFS